ncbi:MAG: hypothetical protein AVDCRST_MAG89-3232, partial [uncultured Gemmatimonadetes bacterium]
EFRGRSGRGARPGERAKPVVPDGRNASGARRPRRWWTGEGARCRQTFTTAYEAL